MTYVDVAYALANRIKFATVRNAAGWWTLPGAPAIAAAAATVTHVPAGGELVIVNPPRSATAAYPIATFTYVIVPSATAKAELLRDFVSWAVTEGQELGRPLFYVPIPPVVQSFAIRQVATIRAPSA